MEKLAISGRTLDYLLRLAGGRPQGLRGLVSCQGPAGGTYTYDTNIDGSGTCGLLNVTPGSDPQEAPCVPEGCAPQAPPPSPGPAPEPGPAPVAPAPQLPGIPPVLPVAVTETIPMPVTTTIIPVPGAAPLPPPWVQAFPGTARTLPAPPPSEKGEARAAEGAPLEVEMEEALALVDLAQGALEALCIAGSRSRRSDGAGLEVRARQAEECLQALEAAIGPLRRLLDGILTASREGRRPTVSRSQAAAIEAFALCVRDAVGKAPAAPGLWEALVGIGLPSIGVAAAAL